MVFVRRWYSHEELNQIKSLTAECLRSREIDQRLRRSEAGIRNIKYRLKMKKRTKETIDSLIIRKKELQTKTVGLKQTKQELFQDVESLNEKKRYYKNQININESLLKQKIEDRLRDLKGENPELFYISNGEQMAMLVGNILKWLIS